MTREKAIDLLDNLIGMVEDNHNSDYDTALKMGIKAIEQEPKWIPVSERLPEKTGWYLVTFKLYDGSYGVGELCYRKPENYWTDKNVCKKLFDNNEVIAWMPLPKPYEPQESEET